MPDDDWADHDIFKRKYILNFKIETLSPMSIRSGASPYGPVDNPIVRMLDRPYIPGSSLKGVLRSEAERIARSLWGDRPQIVCDILHPKDERGELFRKDEAERSGSSYDPCIVCRIFGGPTVASHVYIYDSFPDEDYNVDVRRRVSINRITGGQSPGRLFDVEFVTPRVMFNARIDVENIDILKGKGDEVRLLNYVLSKLFRGGLTIGGMRSVGFGLVRGIDLKMRVMFVEDGELKEVEDLESVYLIMLGDYP